MSSANQFTALGPTKVGFQTDGAEIVRGAEITGTEVGIKGFCGGADAGGEGVIGIGGTNQGTGVVGRGGGVREVDGGTGGVGGIGVHGIGGFHPDPDSNNIPPGIGVLAQGGRLDTLFNTKRRPHGAGVVALAGGSGPGAKPVPPLTETGGVGVFGQGADAGLAGLFEDPTTAALIQAGPGVLGRGGVANDTRQLDGAGVIGLAGDTAIPPISDSGYTGVFGAGLTGVAGQGKNGVMGIGEFRGVIGIGREDRGGVFESAKSAQVRLRPRHLNHPLPFPVPVPVTAIPPLAGHEGVGQHLPKDGVGGDLMTVMDDQRQCTLWFCVRSDSDSPSGHAQWAQVLLGSSFDGQA